MPVIEGWLPPTRENWEFVAYWWQFLPVVTTLQLFVPYWPQGKTSVVSRFNLPGPLAWFLMEVPGMIILSYLFYTLPGPSYAALPSGSASSLPWGNWVMAATYVIHYTYRAILAPLLLNPSMSPSHPMVYCSALLWQTTNAISIGGWLGGYGPRTDSDWYHHGQYMFAGLVIWFLGFIGNIFHDDDLREIRRESMRRQRRAAEKKAKDEGGSADDYMKSATVQKVYMLPKNGLFALVTHAHYLCEWVEWGGWWMVGGLGCVPARSFLLNEMSSMVPRALQGHRWYKDKFGADKVGRRKAVVPGLL